MTHFRVVRFTKEFFEDLDSQLPEERPGDGGPSATDFLLFDLPPVRDLLASEFEKHTTLVPPGGAVFVCVVAGTLVAYFSLYAILNDDDVVEVLGIAIDTL